MPRGQTWCRWDEVHMGNKKITKTPPPAHPTTKHSLTRREVTKDQLPPSADENAAIADKAEATTVEAFLSAAETWARDELAAAGLPNHLKPVRRDAEGRWFDDLPEGWRTKKRKNVLKPGETIATVLSLVEDRPETPEWLAARVLRFAQGTRHHMEISNLKDAVWNAIHLAQTIHLTDFKLNLEEFAKTGMKVRKGARESGKETLDERNKRDEGWRNKARQMAIGNPTLSRESIIQNIWKTQTPKENGIPWSRSTIQRALKKLVKPGE